MYTPIEIIRYVLENIQGQVRFWYLRIKQAAVQSSANLWRRRRYASDGNIFQLPPVRVMSF